MAKEFDLVDELVDKFDARVGFPAYKVFIFGQEVSSDVISVSVNNAGGSVERSPGSCTFTLYNPGSRYTITYNDMISIRKAQSKFYEKFGEAYRLSSNEEILTDADLWGSELANESLLTVESLLDEVSSEYVEDVGVTLDRSSLEALAINLNQNEDRSKEILESLGFVNLTRRAARALGRKLVSKYLKYKNPPKVSLDSAGNIVETSDIKLNVVKSKLTNVSYFANETDDRSTPTAKFSYPYQQGDCIFHFNDPVRIAFRDPFDPTIWYWKFAGFVDTWTENQGTNRDSRISITCTDVSKVPRYATVALGGLFDFNNPFRVNNILEPTKRTEENAGLVFYQELFQGLTVLEILETIFFGSESSVNLASGVSDDVVEFLSSLDIEEIRQYLAATSNTTADKVIRDVMPDATQSNVDNPDDKLKKSMLNQIQEYKISNLNDINFTGLRNPKGITFKKASFSRGVNYFVYGEPDVIDEALGAKKLNSLYDWNEVLHHRVREKDLVDMFNTNLANEEGDYSVPDRVKFADSLTSEDIVEIIGKDIENYPVGGGNVYLMLPAGTESAFLEIGVVLRDFGSIGMHSQFRDRLSYIYDVAENIDFRFYATPKGDIVFEMPFYDFDPDNFWNKEDITDDQLNKYLSGMSYDEIFQKDYDGFYSNLDELMNEVAAFSIDYTRLSKFDYKKEFTIELQDQIGFSNTSTDSGLMTAWRVQPKTAAQFGNFDNSIFRYEFAQIQELIPLIGLRVGEGQAWNFIETSEAAKLYSALQLNRHNAEARNIGLKINPRFGLMVNRPLFWKSRNYYSNIVSVEDSISWHGDVSTVVNLNQVRCWSGNIGDDGRPVYRHFGDADRPFNLAEFVKKALRRLRNKEGVDSKSAEKGTSENQGTDNFNQPFNPEEDLGGDIF